MTIKNAIKSVLPEPLWRYAREHKDTVLDLFRNAGRNEAELGYCGFRVWYTSGMTIVARVRKEGIFEQPLCEALFAQLSHHQRPVLLDIGSNIGLISLYVLSRLPEATIFAFDPGELQHKLLLKTIATNALASHLIQSRVALGERDEEATYFIHGERESSKDGFRNTGRGGDAHATLVTAQKLDTWWKQNGRPRIHAIKIDTEGAELHILRGGEECVAANKPTIFLEIEPRNLAAYPYGPVDIFAWFASHAYALTSLGGVVLRNKEALLACIADGEDTFVASPV